MASKEVIERLVERSGEEQGEEGAASRRKILDDPQGQVQVEKSIRVSRSSRTKAASRVGR